MLRCILYVASAVLAGIKRVLPARAAAAPAASSASTASSVSTATQRKKGGKSLKMLMKESKQAAAKAQAHEHIPDSTLFLNTLKGHTDSVTSVAISHDGSCVMTACADRVRSTLILVLSVSCHRALHLASARSQGRTAPCDVELLRGQK